MVGISFGAIKRAGRWVGGLSARQRILGAALIVALGAGLAWIVTTSRTEARLLRTDPDVASSDAKLMKFAVGRGHGVYEHHCASCHGAKGLGNMAKGVPNLTDDDWLYGEGHASDIETVILYGIRDANPKTWRLADMPAYARKVPYPREPLIPPLSPGDIHDVIAFLATVRGAPASPEAALRGSKIYSDRGGCYDCHGSDAHGDPAVGAPNLSDNIWLFGGDPKTLFNTIAYGRAGYCPAWFNRLSPAKIREAALYVYSLSHPSPSRTSPNAQ
jgi:cytochrome c oxidase cbb3-type subunit 3